MLITDDQLKVLVINTKLLDEKGFLQLASYAKDSGLSIPDALIQKDIITDENLGIMISDFLKIPFVVLGKISIPQDVFHIVPERLARRYKVIPFARDQVGIKLAMADPNNKEIITLLEQKTGQKMVPHLATEHDIYTTLRIYRKELQKAFDQLIKDDQELRGSALPQDAPIEKIVDAIINYAFQDHASDIHIEPEEKDSLVRFRIDGVLQDMLMLPKQLHEQVVSRIKVLSRLRTDEHLSPQDGKLRMKIDGEDLDIRVSILPISEGEKIVMRLLASRFGQYSLVDLGMSEVDLAKVQRAFSKSFGMVLSTGPTGAGKSSTIYAILKILNTREKNITTIEDPVEYRIKGVNQINVNVKTNLTFASGLRSILRQDPNVIFVGEIRDGDTASIAVNAALTGHLVLSTLHTNDAATALPRLADMKVEPFLIASTVNVIIAQRLVRKICELCKSSVTLKREELVKHIPEILVKKHFGIKAELRVYKGQGCKICHTTGYQGRIGVFEVLEVTNAIRDLITRKEDADVIAKQAALDGMTTMLDDGLQKILKGLTTLEEVLRVTKVDLA